MALYLVRDNFGRTMQVLGPVGEWCVWGLPCYKPSTGEICDDCPIIARVDGVLKVCSCECRSCKRKWFDDRRPIVRDGKIFRYGDREPVEEKEENAMTPDGLAPGMVVCLKSGGPSMTLEEIETGRDGRAVCSWFDSTFPDRLHRQRFSLHALVKAPAKAETAETK